MSDKEKLKFHLTVTHNETGEAVHDVDINAFIGAVGEADGPGAIFLTECSLLDMAFTVMAAKRAIETAYAKHPGLPVLVEDIEATINEEEKGE